MRCMFLHGLESSSRGRKGQYFLENFSDMLLPDFQGDLGERMAQLYRIVVGDDQLVLVGSSFGGLMATIFAICEPRRVRRLILLAPALNYHDVSIYGSLPLEVETLVYIGEHDTVTPPSEVEPIVRSTFQNHKFYPVDDDHLLAKTFAVLDWQCLLGYRPKKL